MISIEQIKAALPDYAKDIRLNLGSLVTEASLTVQQRGGVFIAAAAACRNPALLEAVTAEFAPTLPTEAIAAARASAAIMAMNNIYYRFVHEVGGDYGHMPAKLRMSVMARPGVDKADFELYSLAVSAINGCAMCMRSHEKTVREHGVGSEPIQAAIRIAATLHAVATVMDAEGISGPVADSIAS